MKLCKKFAENTKLNTIASLQKNIETMAVKTKKHIEVFCNEASLQVRQISLSLKVHINITSLATVMVKLDYS